MKIKSFQMHIILSLLMAVTTLSSSLLMAQGFPNSVQSTPGSLIQGNVGHQMGRTAIIEYLGGYVITWPEGPGSEPGDDLIVRAWDFSDPVNPRQVATFGETRHPMDAHGTIKRGNQVYLSGAPSENGSAIEVDGSGGLSLSRWRGPFSTWDRSGLYAPWQVRTYWSYGAVSGNAFIELDGVRMAEWDHLGSTGVVGFSHVMGNILLYASDQSLTGIAAYDISDPSNPVLLDILNPPVSDGGGGIGGYWNEIYGHYMVFARRYLDGPAGTFAGLQVVDFSDPSDLRLHCNIKYGTETWQSNYTSETRNADPMYVGFQDEYIFTERFKININTCETELILDVGENEPVETSQYSRPMGNLLLTGGYPFPSQNSDGVGVWVHQEAPDTRGPYVSYHIPRASQTNYPVNLPLTVHIPETLRSTTIKVTETPELSGPETMTLTEVGGDAVRIDYILTHTGLLMIDPVNDLNPNTTYELRLTSGILDVAGNPLDAYSFRFSTGAVVSGDPTPNPVAPPVLDSISVSPIGSVEVNEVVTVIASASDSSGETIEYQFQQSGQPDSSWVTSNMQDFQFSEVGNYNLSVRARNSAGSSGLQAVNVNVIDSFSSREPGNKSSQLYCTVGEQTVWAVNPDNNTITSIDSEGLVVQLENSGSDDPRSIAVSGNGNVWVASHDGDRIDIFDSSGNRIQQLSTGYGSAPFGVVMSPDGNTAYASLYGSGEVVRFDAQSMSETGRLNVGPTPRALALTPDGSRLLVTRFISAENWGEVWDINTSSWSLTRTIRLNKNLVDDDIDNGRGVPNYVSSIIVNGDATRAYLVAKKDNTDRGLLNGIGLDLDDDNTVRTMAMAINLQTAQELSDERIDFDNADSPSSVAMSLDGSILFVGLQGINQVFAINIVDNRLTGISSQIAVGRAPQGLCIDNTARRLFVKNFMERTVSAIDISGSLTNPSVQSLTTVANEVLPAEVLAGKRIFYDAANGRLSGQLTGKMSAEGYISCATCHIDGGHDGRTYDFTGRGEGIRNNISLVGRSGTRFGNVHWTANFDEIQDFEHDIRGPFRGSGFMSDEDFAASTQLGTPKAGSSVDLDNLAAYVASLDSESLPKSPYRSANGSMTDSALRGRTVFNDLGCASCHSGEGYTDGLVHSVGTLRSYSGSRMSEEIPGLKTPSLLSVFDSAPYLHDGSAKSIDDVFSSVGGAVYQAEAMQGQGVIVSHLSANYSYLREGAGLRLAQGEYATLSDVDGGSGGLALIKIRYGSLASQGTLEITVDGESYLLSLEAQPQVNGQDVSFIESSALTVNLPSGANNTITIFGEDIGASGSVIIDDISVSNFDNLQAADSHLVVGTVDSGSQDDLRQYLLQLDRYASEESNSAGGGEGSPDPAPSNDDSSDGGGSLGMFMFILLLVLVGGRFRPAATIFGRF